MLSKFMERNARAMAALFLVLGALLAWHLTMTDWIAIRPTSSLIELLRNDPSPSTESRAFQEITRRMRDGLLAEGDRVKLTNAAIEKIQAGSRTPTAVDWVPAILGNLASKNHLGTSQLRVYTQLILERNLAITLSSERLNRANHASVTMAFPEISAESATVEFIPVSEDLECAPSTPALRITQFDAIGRRLAVLRAGDDITRGPDRVDLNVKLNVESEKLGGGCIFVAEFRNLSLPPRKLEFAKERYVRPQRVRLED